MRTWSGEDSTASMRPPTSTSATVTRTGSPTRADVPTRQAVGPVELMWSLRTGLRTAACNTAAAARTLPPGTSILGRVFLGAFRADGLRLARASPPTHGPGGLPDRSPKRHCRAWSSCLTLADADSGTAGEASVLCVDAGLSTESRNVFWSEQDLVGPLSHFDSDRAAAILARASGRWI